MDKTTQRTKTFVLNEVPLSKTAGAALVVLENIGKRRVGKLGSPLLKKF